MQATTPKMPTTWQIFPDGCNTYRWVISGQDPSTEVHNSSHRIPINRQNSGPRLPSMEDLLQQGSSKLLQNKDTMGENSNPPPSMFRTGLGKSVPVKRSSIMKALSVFGDGGDMIDTGQAHAPETGCSFSNSLFKTGSGKKVNISPAGVTKAKSLLGLEGNSNKFATDDSWGRSPHLEKGVNGDHNEVLDYISVPRGVTSCQLNMYMSGQESREEELPNFAGSEKCVSASKPPPVKFQTAGGRSLSVSNDALQRAMSLLGDSGFDVLPNEGGTDGPLFSFLKESSCNGTGLNKEQEPAKRNFTSKSSLPPKGPHFREKHGSFISGATGGNFFKQENINGFASEGARRPDCNMSSVISSSSKDLFATHAGVQNSLDSRMITRGRSSGGPLVDISNNINRIKENQKQITCEKRKLGRRSSISPFKRPRNSRFSTPFNCNNSFLPNGSYTNTTSEDSGCKAKVSTRYPFQIARTTIKEFFGGPPFHQNQLENVPDAVKCMNADTASTYVFHDTSCLDGIGIEAFRHMLAQSGASMHYASIEWVTNHYKWIVWKLASYERGYPAKASGKYLTVGNVLEELKYRYEREVNHGHRSALKRILEGDASPASLLVLCVSAIRSNPDEPLKLECAMTPHEGADKLRSSNISETSNVAKIELTDGWYAMDAILDPLLTKQLLAGKLFLGQKLRIWRARLCGWVGPVSPLESSKTVSLLLHINGTYRAHWADRLGIRRAPAAPLAFHCIKSAGGLVPRTLVGVKRIYPILYRERLMDGGSIVRSEKMESKMLELYDQRRSTIAEGVMSEFHMDVSRSHCRNDNDSDEGAHIFMILEKAAEPEILMADMSVEQLTSFATYQAKQEALRQSDMKRKIEKALEDAGLNVRQVTPFMRVRVVGLTSMPTQGKGCHKEGLITIWNPTENQRFELAEGQAYMIEGLIPLNSDSETIYLQARGSTTTWKSLPSLAIANLEPFFSPRKPVYLSNMGDIPLASEFDVAAVVVHVGDVYLSGHQKKQWVFVTDGSTLGSELDLTGSSGGLLAISFYSPIVDNDSSALINHTLIGSTVCFLNLVKRARDQMNHLWAAEATDDSTYFSSYDHPGCGHLKEAAGSAYRWAKTSPSAIQKLRERILFIMGNGDRR